MINKTNLFLIGAPKSGTTSLYHYLNQHPNVFMPKIKELHYFSQPEVKDTYYDVYFADTKEKYFNNYKKSNYEKIVGDASPSYLYNHKTAKRIKKFNPNAKIIAILRNPIDRAISHYLMDLRIGYVNKPLIYYLTNKYLPNYKEYIGNSLYSENIKIYKEVFNKNLLVLAFDDLLHKPEEIMIEIFNFLEIDCIKINHKKRYNTFAFPSNSLLFYVRKYRLYNFLRIVTPKYFRDKLKHLLTNKKFKKPAFLEEREILKDIFKDEKNKLKTLFDKEYW